MTELVTITLENEMDLTLAYKRSILTAGMLGLTVATQTAFATAVSEVCREVIDKALGGVAVLGTTTDSGRFFLAVKINAQIDEHFDPRAGGFEYARKLVPVLELESKNGMLDISLQLAIPRATRLDQRRIIAVKKQIEEEGPVSAYEEVKQRNKVLAGLAQQQESALEAANSLNQQRLEFISVASHELNSPLTVLRSYTQMALRTAKDVEPVLQQYLQKVDLQTRKLVSLVRQLMDVSKLEHGKITYEMTQTPLNTFLSDTIASLGLIFSTHQLKLDLTDDRSVTADPLRLEQVLSNLVGNAVKYSSAGSSIRIATRTEGDQIHISVTDQGIGMSEATQRQVFEKFYRNKQIEKRYSGLGMGLYIAAKIIDDHRGAITVSSKEGEGSVFSFSLPVVA